MPNPESKPSKNAKVLGIPARVLAILAIVAGTMSCFQRAMRGQTVGADELIVFGGPAIVLALIALAGERSRLTYAALVIGLLGMVAVMVGNY
jgi:hypothetical protein